MSGSRRAHTPRTSNPDTSTGTDHVRGHTTMSPPTPTTKRGPTKRGHRHETATQSHGHTKARADARPWIQIYKDPQTRDARVRTKTPEAPAPGPRPEPLSPGSPIPLVRVPYPGRAPGAPQPLPTPWIQEKLRGPGTAPRVQRRPPACPPDGAARLRSGAPDLRPQRGLGLRPGPTPTWKPAPLPPRRAHPGGPAAGPPAGAFLAAARPAPQPPPAAGSPPALLAPSDGSGPPPNDVGSVAKVPTFPARARPAPRPPAKP